MTLSLKDTQHKRCVIMLSVVLRSAIRLNVVILNVVAPCQPSPMFVGKARSLPKSGTLERYFTWVGSDPTCKH